MTTPRHLLVLIAAAGLAACASGRRLSPPPPEPAAPTRAQRIRAALPQNVRIVVADGGEPVRSGSAVVVGARAAPSPVSWVMTNAHVVAARPGERTSFRVLVDSGQGAPNEHQARLLAAGEAPGLDLALLEVEGTALPAAPLASDDELEIGADVFVVAAPYGRALSVSAGLVSRIEREPQGGRPQLLKTDAAIGYGASGGGIFCAGTGRLLGLVEGYRTAKVTVPAGERSYSFDVPMPGETFAAPAAKLRGFLRARGLESVLDGEAPAAPAAAEKQKAPSSRREEGA